MELKCNKGFTLAEVLITLVIIGVIAAITIPTIIANARRQEASARIKKFYSTISQASLRAKALGNDWEEWADSAADKHEYENPDTVETFAQKYLLPYLNYTDSKIKGSSFSIYLTDGSFFTINKGYCIDFIYDLNGLKKPNEYGKDEFDFLYCPYSSTGPFEKGKIIPYIDDAVKSREQALNNCKNNPLSCSALLAIDNWEFKKDYPYNI